MKSSTKPLLAIAGFIIASCINAFSQCSVVINASSSSICTGQSVNLSAITTSCGSGATFLWSTGQTSQTILVSPTNSTYATIQAAYTVTVTWSGGTTTATKNIPVKPIPNIIMHNNAPSICSGDTCSIYPTSSVANATYQWTWIASGATGAANGSGLAISQNLTSTANPSGTITYSIMPRAGGCNGTPMSTTVTVNTVPTVSFTNNTSSICSGDSCDINIISNISSATFAWVYWPIDVTGAWADTGNYIHQPLSATTTGTGMVTYDVTANNNGCNGPVNSVTVNVLPLPITVSIASNSSICNNDSALLYLSSVPAGATFNWTAFQNNATGASSGSSDTIYQQLSLIVPNSMGNVVYTVTSQLNGCTGNTITDTIEIKPIPDISMTPSDPEICSGTSPNIQLSSVPSGAFFTWNLTNVNNVTGASSGSGNLITQGLISNDTVPGSVTYVISAFLDGCAANEVQNTVTVKPLPDAIITPANSTICSGTAAILQISSSQSGVSYNWTATSNTVLGYMNGGGSNINQTLSVVNNPDSVVYTVTPDLDGCQGAAAQGVVYVSALPVINICGFTQSLCSGETTSIFLQSQNSPNATFSWTASSTWVNGCGGGTGDSIVQTLILTNSTPGSVVYDVTATDNGCASDCNFTINVNPTPVASIVTSLPDTICSNYTPIQISASPSGGIFTGAAMVTSLFYPSLAGSGYSAITYSYTNALNCSSSVSDSIYVDVCAGYDKVSSTAYEQFSVSPNPASSNVKFAIYLPSEDLVSITIVDDKGKEVFSSPVFKVNTYYEYNFDVWSWKKGLYCVMLHTTEGNISRKILVTN